MIIQQIFLTVKPSSVKEFIDYTMDNVVNSNREPGVKRFEFFKEKDSGNRFMLFEIFNTVEDQNSHRESAHYKKWKDKTADLLEIPYTRTVFDYVDS